MAEPMRISWLIDLLADMRFGSRMLRRSPGFALAAILTLALGIGANTAMFSIADGLMWRPPPFDHAERLYWVYDVNATLECSRVESINTVTQCCGGAMSSGTKASNAVAGIERLLDKWAVEECTSLDITTIYRQMKSGRFPRPVRVGIRRVAWRASDIGDWQNGLVVGTAEPPNPNHRRRRMARKQPKPAGI